MSKWAILCRIIRAADCFADVTSRNKSPERILRIVLTCPILLVIAFSIRKGDTAEKVLTVFIIKNLAESLHACCNAFNDVISIDSICCSLTGDIDGIWPPSRHKEDPGLNDGVEFSTRSAQEQFAASGGKGGRPFFFIGGKSIFPIFVSIFGKNTDYFQFHRSPRQATNSHTFLTCQVEPPEDSSKLENGETPITCCRARSKAEAKEDFSI
ncbi:hypothetical protein TNCT_614521 [Trichonephila clavata]|uniref:Uncharacterized protein n=1 Tax=Trichonephila clavata TaxID=2740835 RepID=A0A8X6KTF7_TRICU|nr:hypothetical protein TNCT_614521 [Trichonephila clavata]